MIISVLQMIIAYLVPWFMGLQILNLLDRKYTTSLGVKLFAGALIGMGMFTMEGFILGIFSIPLVIQNYLLLLLFSMVFLEGLALVLTKRPTISIFKQVKNTQSKPKWFIYLLLLMLGVKVVASLWQVTHIPTFEFDAWNNWNLRAKIIYTQEHLPIDSSGPFYLGAGIKSYPLNDSLWKVWTASMAGTWNEYATGLSAVIYYILLLGLFYFSLPFELNINAKMGATYLLGSIPYLYFHSWIPYADLAFTAYVFLTISALYHYLRTSRKNFWLWISAIGLALSIWTKNEGFVVLLPVLFTVMTFMVVTKSIRLNPYIRYWILAFLIASPWLIFRFINKLDLLSGDSGSFHFQYNSQFLIEALDSIFLRSHFNFLWLLFFLLVIFGSSIIWKNLSTRIFTIIVILLFLFYNGIILFTDRALDLSALARVNLHIAPLAALLIVIYLQDKFSKKTQEIS